MKDPVRTPFWMSTTVLVTLALSTGVAWLWTLEQDARRDAERLAQDVALSRPHPATVTRAVRALRLITVELDTSVQVQRGDENWRGDVLATLTAPVRLSYGVDLSRLDASRVRFSQTLGHAFGAPRGAYVVRIPPPTRLATQTFSEGERADVETRGLRLRSRAGEYYLGQARQALPIVARDATLSQADFRAVRDATREQVAELVRALVGEDALVLVRFDDDLPRLAPAAPVLLPSAASTTIPTSGGGS